jgi:hypothetical protein
MRWEGMKGYSNSYKNVYVKHVLRIVLPISDISKN